MSSRPILVLAGGTGGHVYPALAVAQALRQQSREIVWLGTHAGLESRVVPAAGIDMEWISVKGLRRKGVISLVLAPLQLLLALMQSLRVILKHKPAAVLGMGGFVSGPGGKSSSGASCPGCAAGLPGQFFPWYQSRNRGKSGTRGH
jgi:UDP-N-acetylglucosamine--N-acetylmuramyl-(pentapeptide) pyrophosphoryl-undecaprenol N-acetylglucosamine transferase